MNKNEFIRELGKLNFPKQDFVILSGGSLLMRGLREQTADLDLSVSKELARQIDLYSCPAGDYGLYAPFENVEMRDDMDQFPFDIVDGYQCQTLESILEKKRSWNRPKDQKDIAVIEAALNKKCE